MYTRRMIVSGSRLILYLFLLCVLAFTATAYGESLPNTSETQRTTSFGKLRFQDTETISLDTFPPFIIQRAYNSDCRFRGIFGYGWGCWPFDAALEKRKVQEREVLSIKGKTGGEELFVQVEDDMFVPVDPAKIDRASVQKTPDGYVMLDLLNGKQVFDNAGRLVQVSDTRGNKLDITRNEGIPAAVTVYQPRKMVFKIKYDPKRKRLVEISAPDGRAWRYEYDPDDNLSKVINDKNFTLSHRYNNGYLVERADSRGRWVKYRYDKQGRLAEINRNGRKEKREYTLLDSGPEDRMVTSTDAIGRKTEFRFLVSKRQEVIREKDGNVIVRQYDEKWQLEHISSLKDGVTSFERDEQGRPIGILNPRNQLTQIRYDNVLGLPSTVIDERGRVNKFRYNAHGQLASSLGPDERELSVRYNRFGMPLRVDDTAEGTTRFEYDATGKLKTADNSQDGKFDAAELEPPKDLAGFLRKPAFWDMPIPAQRRELIKSLDQAVVVKSDLEKRTATIKAKAAEEWLCSYDVFGNLTSIREKDKHIADFAYDAADRLSEIRYFKSTVETFEYDAGDRVICYVDPSAKVYKYQYDPQGNLIEKTLPGGEKHVFEYDLEGNLISAFDSFWHDLFDYDSRGRLVKIGRLTPVSDGPEVLVTYTYDNESRITSELFANGLRCSYEYNQDGTMETLRFKDIKIVIQYDSHGRSKVVYWPGGMKLEYGYTQNNKLSRLALKDSKGNVLLSQFCQYQDERSGKVISRIDQETTEYELQYTRDGRIANTPWSHPPTVASSGTDTEHSYDAFGFLRRRKTKEVETEYSYAVGGVFHARCGQKEQYCVRSSDGIIRVVVQDGEMGFILPSALPGQAFIMEENQSQVRPVEFIDAKTPYVWIGGGRFGKK